MPITLNIITEHNLALFKHEGSVSDEEFLSFYRSAYEEKKFDFSMNLLVDLRKTDSSKRNTQALQDLAEIFERKSGEMTGKPKVAVVAPESLSFGLARMYEAFTEFVSWEFVVFRDIEAAHAWLGLPGGL